MIHRTLLRGLVLRWLARHRARSALAVVAVALGVAAFLASAAVADAIVRSARAVQADLAGGADLSLEADETGLPQAAVLGLEDVSGVAAAAPRILGWARAEGAGARRVLVVGVDPFAEARYATAAGETLPPPPPNALLFAAGRAAFLGGPLADELGVTTAGTVSLQGTAGATPVVVAGVLRDARIARAARGRVVVVSLGAAQALLGRPGRVDRLDVLLDAGADAGLVASALREAAGGDAPAHLYVGPPRLRDAAASDVMGTVDVAMRVGAVIALLIGVFLIHHTVAVGVAERRREVGILRALGATRSQVRRVFAAEAAVLGLSGALLGIGLSVVLAHGALEGFAGAVTAAYFGSEPSAIRVSPELAAVGLVIGVGVALVAAWLPASQAAGLAPNDAVRRGPDGAHGAGSGSVLRRAVAAAVLTSLGIVLVVVPDLLGTASGYVALSVVLVAFLAASPMVLRIAAGVLAPSLTWLFGVPGRLAADDLLRHPRRAALPAAALAFGLALVTETAGALGSVSDETVRWMEDNIAGDLFVSSGKSVMGGGGHTPLPASLAADVGAVPGVAHVVKVRFRRLPWRDTRLFVLGLDIAAYEPVWKLPLREGSIDDHREALLAGAGCIVSENFVYLHGLDIGDTVTLPGASRAVTYRIVDVFRDYSWPRGTVILDQPHMAELLDDPLVDEFSVTLTPDADVDAAEEALAAALGPDREIVVTRAEELRRQAREVLVEIFSLANAQVAVALAVAFLGVLNTLWISVVLRRREMGLLRSVGATRAQVARAIVIEAGVLGVVGAVLGLVGGGVVQWVLLARIIPADTGWVYPMEFPWLLAGIVAVLGVVTSAIAGWFPARIAARTPLADALAYE